MNINCTFQFNVFGITIQLGWLIFGWYGWWYFQMQNLGNVYIWWYPFVMRSTDAQKGVEIIFNIYYIAFEILIHDQEEYNSLSHLAVWVGLPCGEMTERWDYRSFLHSHISRCEINKIIIIHVFHIIHWHASLRFILLWLISSVAKALH